MTAQSAPPARVEVRIAVLGFLVSLFAGMMGLILGLVVWGWTVTNSFAGSIWEDLVKPDVWVQSLLPVADQNIGISGAIATLSALVVIIGAALIYTQKETVGGILVIAFSVIGLISLGFPIAIINVIGIVGGLVGLAKR